MSANNIMAGCGFARMAWELAKWRTRPPHRPFPHRIAAAQCWTNADSEYYRICDNATRGMSAYNAAYKLGMVSETFTVRL